MPSVTFRSFSSVPYFLCSEPHLLVQQFNLFFHRHVQNFSSWIYHSGLLLYCLVQCIPDGWIFIKESSRQSSFLHQLWNADTFFICQHILYCCEMPVQFSLYFFSDFPQSSCRICSYSSPHLARLIYMMSLILLSYFSGFVCHSLIAHFPVMLYIIQSFMPQ